MTLFALVHGGAHGGWCWERLVPELEARGHAAVTPDLPFDEGDAGAEAWARTVVDAVDAATPDDDVVVVGHSLAGMCLPVIPAMRPVRRLVFLAAQVPDPGRVYLEHLAENPDAVTFEFDRGGTPGPAGLSWEAARDGFYQDLDEDVARGAFERLRSMASMAVFTEPCPIDEWPDVRSTYILMTDDRAVGPTWSRRAAERIGADLVELPGGHSPFYARPAELADVLVRL